MITTVAFDGDDTLWDNEPIFSVTHDRFRALMAPYLEGSDIDERLFATELRNLSVFGYGVKSFTLSMIETAIDMTEGRVGAREIEAIVEAGKEMMRHPVDLIDGVAGVVEAVSASHRLLLITKGDLFHQESKLARSGLGDHFAAVEIVSEKDTSTYERILRRYEVEPDSFVMVGDSMRSDIAPVLEVGGWAVHVPYPVTWAHEHVEDPASIDAHERFHRVDSLREVPRLLTEIGAA